LTTIAVITSQDNILSTVKWNGIIIADVGYLSASGRSTQASMNPHTRDFVRIRACGAPATDRLANDVQGVPASLFGTYTLPVYKEEMSTFRAELIKKILFKW